MKQVFYLTSEKSISYDDEGWYVSGIQQSVRDGDAVNEFKEYAINAAYQQIQKDICAYVAHFKNIAVLTAAGTSMENGKNTGKTRKELWESYKAEINAIQEVLTQNEGFLKEHCLEIVKAQNIEDFLSFTILYEKLNGPIIKDGKELRLLLEKKIADACRLKLDDENRHHQDFLRKLTARKPGDPRVQLYTTNYDTLFEQAATRLNYTLIDGFSFSYPRIFNGNNFDRDIVYRTKTRINQEESFVPGVLQLFKLHGSVDWEKENDLIKQKENVEYPCIIYPASDKYESSYEQPYFEMMAHLQQTLRKESTMLIVAGFGFQDKHIQNVIHEAVIQNPNFHLIIVCYGSSPFEIEDADGKKVKWDEIGITSHLIPGYLNSDGQLLQNVTVIYSKFKKFVEIYPLNPSYTIQNNNYNETF